MPAGVARGEDRRDQPGGPGAYDDDAWKEMSELGWAGIFIEEQHGGQGLGVVELVILMEELGFVVAPSPDIAVLASQPVEGSELPIDTAVWYTRG